MDLEEDWCGDITDLDSFKENIVILETYIVEHPDADDAEEAISDLKSLKLELEEDLSIVEANNPSSEELIEKQMLFDDLVTREKNWVLKK